MASEKSGRPKSPELSRSLLARLGDLLEDPKAGMALKREAMEFLAHRPTQAAADKILEILSGSEEHPLRLLLIRTLLRMRDRNSALRWNRSLLKKEIFREVGLYQDLRRLRHLYLKTAERKEEFLEVALNALADESLERLFRCLGLLYRGEGIRIIYDRLVEHPQTDAIRSHAVELLQNLVGPEFYGVIEKLFDGSPLEDLSEEEAAAILEEMIVSPDRWLSLISHFVATESGLAKRWPRLESLVSSRSFESLDL